MYRTVKLLKHKKFGNPFVTNKDIKRIINPNAIFGTMIEHFFYHFYKEHIPRIESLQENQFDKLINAIKKLNNNRAAEFFE